MENNYSMFILDFRNILKKYDENKIKEQSRQVSIEILKLIPEVKKLLNKEYVSVLRYFIDAFNNVRTIDEFNSCLSQLHHVAIQDLEELNIYNRIFIWIRIR